MNIKNTLFLVLAFGLIHQDTQAQKQKKQQKVRTHIGLMIEAGVAQTTYKGFPYKPEDAKIAAVGSFSGGLFVEIPITKHLAIQPEIIYSQCGFRRQVDLANGLDDYTRRINYFETPLSVKFKTGGLSISAGAKIGFLNKASMTVKEGMARSYADETYLYQKTAWSALIGFEYTFHRHFGFQLRYSFGLNDIADHNANNGYPTAERLYPNAFRFGMHYKF